MEKVQSDKGFYIREIVRSGWSLESGWCIAEIWKFPELMHRLAARSLPPSDDDGSAGVAFFLVEGES